MSNKVELHTKVLHALQGRYLVYFVYLCYFERLCILDIQFVRPGKDMSFSTIFAVYFIGNDNSRNIFYVINKMTHLTSASNFYQAIR